MARISKKKDKTIYREKREELGYSRDKASEVLKDITPYRIARIENGTFTAYPEEVICMANGYKCPELCNYYCVNECAIGKKYETEVKIKDLSQIVLEVLASLNSVKRRQERLIEITADCLIEKEEVEDFIKIQEELDRISVTAETLQLWAEQKLLSGEIDQDAYNKAKNKKSK